LEGKFSLPYTLAAGALDGKYTLETFTDAAVRRPEIERFYARIQAAEDPSCRGDDPHFEKLSSGSRGFVEVEVRLRDGRTERVRVDKAPGSPGRDMSWDELRTKFMDCARQSRRITQDAAGRAFEAIRNIENADDIGSIVRLLH